MSHNLQVALTFCAVITALVIYIIYPSIKWRRNNGEEPNPPNIEPLEPEGIRPSILRIAAEIPDQSLFQYDPWLEAVYSGTYLCKGITFKGQGYSIFLQIDSEEIILNPDEMELLTREFHLRRKLYEKK